MLLPRDDGNPIRYISELRRFPWWPERPDPDTSHVYLSARDHLFLAKGGLTLGEHWWRAPRRLYVVDAATQDAELDHALISPRSGRTVDLLVSLRWRVADPVQVVRLGLVDVAPVLRRGVGDVIRSALAEAEWDTVPDLLPLLSPDRLPDAVAADCIEVSRLRATVLSLETDPATPDG